MRKFNNYELQIVFEDRRFSIIILLYDICTSFSFGENFTVEDIPQLKDFLRSTIEIAESKDPNKPPNISFSLEKILQNNKIISANIWDEINIELTWGSISFDTSSMFIQEILDKLETCEKGQQ